MHILGIIPARGGSKGILGKNIKMIAGKPLIAWTIEAAKKSKLDSVIVSTDDENIDRVAQEYGALTIKRPADLASDTAPTELAVIHVLQELLKQRKQFDYVLILQPTSPLRDIQHINEAVALLRTGDYDSIVGVTPVYKYQYQRALDGRLTKCFSRRAHRQERSPVWLENGALYGVRSDLAMTGDLFGKKIGSVVMADSVSVNIDNPSDFYLAEILLQQKFG